MLVLIQRVASGPHGVYLDGISFELAKWQYTLRGLGAQMKAVVHVRIQYTNKRVEFDLAQQVLLVGFCKVARGADGMYVAQIISASQPERLDVVQLEHTIFAANAA